MRPELLGDPEYKGEVLNGYFNVNWSTIRTRGIKSEDLNVVRRGENLGKSYGIRKKLERELMQQAGVLAALQCQVASSDVSEADCCEAHTRIEAIRNRLDSYVHRDFRQRLYREGDCLK
ncbi:hypothetical protein NDU88_003949 [Pleurodeles waltl]|uniref:Uncharacterized protein n=1 Tax=Pleurodeles waltl TaxID=8319 RepID=A0AAV7RH99_PLEWA|nr:hypothetical protein NDU88_003949 [Pleurodeles waltl]